MSHETEIPEKNLRSALGPESIEAPVFMRVSGHAADRISVAGLAPLDWNELTSINALLYYVAMNQHVQQETVQAVVEARFGVDSVDKLARKDYDEVIRFLVDLCMEEMLH